MFAPSRLTWNDIARIHSILVLNEPESIHELDLGDIAGAVSVEMCLDSGFGSITGEVAQVEAGRGYLGHGSSGCQALSC